LNGNVRELPIDKVVGERIILDKTGPPNMAFIFTEHHNAQYVIAPSVQ
jgi:hypothetical protein